MANLKTKRADIRLVCSTGTFSSAKYQPKKPKWELLMEPGIIRLGQGVKWHGETWRVVGINPDDNRLLYLAQDHGRAPDMTSENLFANVPVQQVEPLNR